MMYMGGTETRSISAWNSFFSGFWMAEEFHQIPSDECMRGFDWPRFEQWLEEQYPGNYSPCFSSFALARDMTKSESEGFDLWCSWYDSYQSLKNKI
jgi:hypothetical protein